MPRKQYQPPPLENRKLTVEQIDSAINKFQKRITEVGELNPDKVDYRDAQVDVIQSSIRKTILDTFGENSHEYREHGYFELWDGAHFTVEDEDEAQMKFAAGIPRALTILKGFISNLQEMRDTLGGVISEMPVVNFWSDIHPKITAVARTRYESNHYADAVEAAFKEINSVVKDIVKRKTNNELDGAGLMKKAFSVNNPIIVLDDISTETGRNIQQGYMDIFAGAMTGIRNPKAHNNLNITKNRAMHFIYLASLLMNKIDERV